MGYRSPGGLQCTIHPRRRTAWGTSPVFIDYCAAALVRHSVRGICRADRARSHPGGDGACRSDGEGVANTNPDALRDASRVAAIRFETPAETALDRVALPGVRR